MEEPLKNILKTHRTFAELTAAQRKQLAEWCADEQEFQAMKSLIQQVDVWSAKKDDDKNTKQRLDQLFAFQYAGKQSANEGPSSKQRFLSMKTWIPISAVAAALVLTWYLYPTNPHVQLAKNKTQKEERGQKQTSQLKETQKAEERVVARLERNVQPQEIQISEERASVVEMSAADTDYAAVVSAKPSKEEFSNSLANGSSFTLTPTGIPTYPWGAASLSEVQVTTFSKQKNRKDQVDGRMEKDAFTAFSLKSMPEMLDVLVASY